MGAWSRSRLAQNSCGDLKKNSFLDRDGRWEPLNDEANGRCQMIPLQGVNIPSLIIFNGHVKVLVENVG